MQNLDIIEAKIKEFIPKSLPEAQTVYKAMSEAVLNGGKRIRPLMMYETYKLFKNENADIDEIAPFMAAIEMIHTSSLIHDDLPCMDNDTLRRGKPTTWVSFGEDMAVLSGDALIVLASEIIYSAILNQKNLNDMSNAARAGKILFSKTGMEGMIGGQVVDVEKTGKTLNFEDLDFIYRLKTAALLEASLMIGAVIGGGDELEVKKIEKIALNIGMAFQIQDDILDETSSEKELGKPIHSDKKNQKTTYVTLFGIEKSKRKVKELSDEALTLLDDISKKDTKRDTKNLIDIIGWLIERKS
jgi:farnesyltranstransferase